MPENVVSLSKHVEDKRKDAVLNLFCSVMALKQPDRDRIKQKYLER